MKLTMNDGLIVLEAVKSIYYSNFKEAATANPPNSIALIEREKLPFGMKYRLIKIKETLEKETALFGPEREALIRKYGEEIDQEDGQKILKVKEPEMQNYIKEINDVLLTQIEVEFPKLTAQDVEKLEEKEIELNEIQMKLLTKFVFE